MTPTEDERFFSKHIATVKPLKYPSVFRPPHPPRQIQALTVRQFVSVSEIKTTVTPIASMSAVKFPLNILVTIKTQST